MTKGKIFIKVIGLLCVMNLFGSPNVNGADVEDEEDIYYESYYVKREWGVDYFGDVDVKEIVENFDKFKKHKYIQRTCVEARNNTVLSKILDVVENTDLHRIFGLDDYEINYYYLYGTNEIAIKGFESCIDYWCHECSDDTIITSLSQGKKDIFIEGLEKTLWYTMGKYFFAFKNKIFLTSQWFEDFFERECFKWGVLIREKDMCVLEKKVVWHFILDEGQIVESTVGISQLMNNVTPIYNFQTGVLETIVTRRE